jgi:hypothetical protein
MAAVLLSGMLQPLNEFGDPGELVIKALHVVR